MTSPLDAGVDGALLFTRFAYAPNALGYCGPADSSAMLYYGANGTSDGGLRQLAMRFEGAWPYLELIAAANRIDDALDPRVVEAYWIGNQLLDRVPVMMLGNSLDDRFRRRAAEGWSRLTEVLEVGACPHHNFHVFSIYPWVGMLGHGRSEEPLRVLDRCRIRWGRVEGVIGDQVMVRSRPLEWTGGTLRLGSPQIEAVAWRRDGHAFIPPPAAGQWVAMHWDWVCDVLSPGQLAALRQQTRRQLEAVNLRVAHSGPAAVLA